MALEDNCPLGGAGGQGVAGDGAKCRRCQGKVSPDGLGTVAGGRAKCCRSAKNDGPATVFCFCGRFASQVTPKTQTCDGLSKDLRRGVMRPATKLLSLYREKEISDRSSGRQREDPSSRLLRSVLGGHCGIPGKARREARNLLLKLQHHPF